MSTALRLCQHEESHRTALHMTGAGAAAGLATHVSFQGMSSLWAVTLVAAAAVLGALAPWLRARASELAVWAGGLGHGLDGRIKTIEDQVTIAQCQQAKAALAEQLHCIKTLV